MHSLLTKSYDTYLASIFLLILQNISSLNGYSIRNAGLAKRQTKV